MLMRRQIVSTSNIEWALLFLTTASDGYNGAPMGYSEVSKCYSLGRADSFRRRCRISQSVVSDSSVLGISRVLSDFAENRPFGDGESSSYRRP